MDREHLHVVDRGIGVYVVYDVHRLNHLLLLAAHHGDVVIVGRGARFLLPRERGLSVRILAPLDFRIEQVLLQRGLSAKEARKAVEESDRQREAFVREHFYHKAADPHLYDLVINVEKLVQEDAADLIVNAALSWMRKSGVTIPSRKDSARVISVPSELPQSPDASFLHRHESKAVHSSPASSRMKAT